MGVVKPTAACMLAALCAEALSATPIMGSSRLFEIVGPQGQRLGYQVEQTRSSGTGHELLRERTMAYRIDGHGETAYTWRLVRSYSADGKLVAVREELRNNGRISVTEGTVADGVLLLNRTVDGKQVQRRLDWPAGSDLADPLAIEQAGGSRLELAQGGLRLIRREVRLLPYSGGILRLGYVDGRLDNAEVVPATASAARPQLELPYLGYSLAVRLLDAEAKLEMPAGRPVQLQHEMQPSPFYVPAGALRRKIRYQFASRFGFEGTIPDTGQQAVAVTEGGWQIDVCESCGPGLPSDPDSLRRWQQPSPWIESDAPEFVAAVRPVVGTRMSAAARMARLQQIARARMATIDFEGYRSARSAWRRRNGDCTEDAVVLAALARAAGIPARVASGLTYSRVRYHGMANAYMPHAWVVAWVDGRWRSYDIALEGFDASHIALALSDGEPAGYREANVISALLDWQGMSEVRSRDPV